MEPPQLSRSLNVLLHLLFFISGIATVLIGPILPILARHFELNDLTLSWFFPPQFAGSICGSFLTSRFSRRDSLIAPAVLGGFLMAAGVATMAADNYLICLSGFFINGLGLGLSLQSINMIVMATNIENSASALNILNFCWGAGAIVAKPFVDSFSRVDSLHLTTFLLAGMLLVSTISVIVAARKGARLASRATGAEDMPQTPIWTTTLAWAIAFFNLLHVGFETGIGGWLATYTERIEGGFSGAWLTPTLLYFTFFVLGRGVAPMFFRFAVENTMIFAGLLIVLAGIILTVTTPTVLLLDVGSILCGFGTSWIFPTNVARFSRVFGPTAVFRATPFFVCGTLGAAISTWLIGFFSNQSGSLRNGMLVLAICIAILIVLQIFLSKAGRRQAIN